MHLSITFFALLLLAVLLPRESLAGKSSVFKGLAKTLYRGPTRTPRLSSPNVLKAARTATPLPSVPSHCTELICKGNRMLVGAVTPDDFAYLEAKVAAERLRWSRRLEMIKRGPQKELRFGGESTQGHFLDRGSWGDVYVSQDGQSVIKYNQGLNMFKRERVLSTAYDFRGFPVGSVECDSTLLAFRKPLVRGHPGFDLRGVTHEGRWYEASAKFKEKFGLAVDNLVGDISYYHQRELVPWMSQRGISVDDVIDHKMSDFKSENIFITYESDGALIHILDP